jgi:hypothetical protein
MLAFIRFEKTKTRAMIASIQVEKTKKRETLHPILKDEDGSHYDWAERRKENGNGVGDVHARLRI